MRSKFILSIAFYLLSIVLFSQNNGITAYTFTTSSGYSGYSKRTCFTIDNLGRKWITNAQGTGNSAVLMCYDDTTWKVHPYVFPGTKAYAVVSDVNNHLWVGTNFGLFEFNDTTLVNTYNTGNSAIPTNTITVLACGGGSVYVGSNSGLSVLSGGVFTNYNRVVNGMKSDTVLTLSYENNSAVWIGNNSGIEKFNGSGVFAFSNVVPSIKDSVMCVYTDGVGNKWIGTNSHGVIKYDNSNFYSMLQLFGTPLGVKWPVRTYSIGKGPNGGVIFADLHTVFSPPNARVPGSLEIVNNSVNIFSGIAPGNLNGTIYNYYQLQFDNVNGKLYYAYSGASGPTFLYSFTASQFTQNIITQSNSGYLDINNVSALITANADMSWDLQGTKYFVPKNTNSSPLKASSLWIGGFHNGSLRMGAMTYRQNGMDFWPGPLDTIKDTIDVNTQNAFNRVWKVNRFDIANFIYNWNAGNVQNGTFFPAASILSWPAHGPGAYSKRLAPFVDVNGNGIYDPINDGDYPLIKGDQMIWWVFNDRGGKHSETGAIQMGIEVQASAYAFVCPNIADSNKVLNYTTFYNYKIVNRSPDQLDSTYITNWMDTDLGNYQDDYIGCDVMNNYGYIFNGDNYDEDGNGLTGYHANMPALSCNILSGPAADVFDGRDNNNNGVIDEPNEKCMMRTFVYYTNTGDPQTGNPSTNQPLQYYNFMNAKWRNGTPMTYGGNGTNSINSVCRHLFPALSDPYGISLGGSIANPITPAGSFGPTGWTQQQANVVKNDMRFLTGCGPFTMMPGGSYEYDYAFVFSQDSANCDSNAVCVLPRAQQDNIRVKRWFDNNSFPSCLSLVGVGIKENILQNADVKLYPNPAENFLSIEIKEAKGNVTVELFDTQGKLIKGAYYKDAQKYLTLPVDDLSKGIYIIKIKTVSGSVAKKFIKE